MTLHASETLASSCCAHPRFAPGTSRTRTCVGPLVRNFGIRERRFGPALIGPALPMLSAGLLLGTIRPSGFEQAIQPFGFYLDPPMPDVLAKLNLG